MFVYYSRIYEKYRLPIVHIAVFNYVMIKDEPDTFTITFPFKDILSFHFFTLELKKRNWRDYIKQPNLVALALLGKTGYDTKEKVQMKFEFLRTFLKLELDPARQKLVHAIFEKYHKLRTEEEIHLYKNLKQFPNDEVNQIRELMTSWEKKGYNKGIEKGIEKGKIEEKKSNLSKN
ncbi:hypothetical protein BKP37_08080 [Anaerobacillus alkalilacustris]|uniref:Transposase (putative) YhgA-like domain-containing protein n=1 Tax=Anaerobacillus alkalilacustris TaxID=393763 RepID=A0A1S2LPW8_9BACI|nr:hypothetical protein [Anaerobacillus alkalilacustris]OIJ14569.1 hypothetical protein BKP37_08080 [Anaerobacillus alkalilacustris]